MPHGWDGSEEMLLSSSTHCRQLPESKRVALCSWDIIIVTLQGIQATYSLANGLIGNGAFGATIALDSIFSPLAICGLFRLFAALWLTDDFVFSYVVPTNNHSPMLRIQSEPFPGFSSTSAPNSPALQS
jgi:hypothetical protein